MDNSLKADYAQINSNIGIYEEFANYNFQESLRRYKKAEDVMQDISGYPAVKFGILGQTAQMYIHSGDVPNAEQYLLKAEKIISEYSNADLDKGLYWYIKAKLFLIKGQKADALMAIDKNLEVDAHLDQNSTFTAPTYRFKAEVLNSLARYYEAYLIIKKVFDQQIGDKVPDHEFQARILTTLASVEANLSKLDDGLKHIEQACAIFQNGNAQFNINYSAAVEIKGSILAKKGQYKAALESYLESEKAYRNRYRENFGTTQDIRDLLRQAAEVAGKAQDKENEDRLKNLLVKYFGQSGPVNN